MGVCASCLGLSRRDNNQDSETSRLLEDDIYHSNYGYGALNHPNQHHQDPEYLKREREALDAICQRTSDSVIDIWSLQPQPHLQPQATLQSSTHADKDRPDAPVPVTVMAGPEHPRPVSSTKSDKSGGAVPKHWGEVVINPRRGKGSRPGSGSNGDNGRNVFGVLDVN